ncbi:MAG: S8 family serine peptidase [Treponema sp.]|nr:S8 family serine peptidase [Treponema sp.]
MKKRFFTVFLTLLLPLVVLTVQCRFDAPVSGIKKQTNRSVETGFDEGKIYSNATLQDSFAEDRVLIVLKKSASMDFRTYTPEDFPELNGVQVRDLSKRTMAVVQEQLKAQKTGDWSRLTKRIEQGMLVDVNKFKRILCLELPIQSKENVLQAIKLLEQRNDIMYAGPDTMIEFCGIPNPPPIHYEYYQEDMYNSISLPAAWDYINTNVSNNIITMNPVKIGVLDTGIAVHSDLYNRVDSDLSHDFWTEYPIGVVGDPFDDQVNHGTSVAGIISANGTGLIGVTGVYQDIMLVSLKLGYLPWTSIVLAAVDYVNNINDNNYDEFIDILNFSGFSFFNFSLYTAINQYTGLFVCAAGNNGYDNDNVNTPVFPANWTTDFHFRNFSGIPYFPNAQYVAYLPRISNLISVGAYTIDKTTTPYVERRSVYQDPGWENDFESNYGATTVDLFAPTAFWSTHNNGSYGPFGGTSSAAPFVAGVAALVKSMHPGLTGLELKDILLASVVEVPDLKDNNYCRTGGKLNAENAVKQTLNIGSMDIVFAGVGHIGKFHLRPDMTWEIAEKRIFSSPISSFANNPENVYLYPVPSEITTYMIQNNIDDISDYFYLWVPVTGTPDAIYYKHEFYFTMTSTGVYYCNYTGNTTAEEVFLPSEKRMIKVAYTSGQTVSQIPNIGSIDISIGSSSSTYGSTTPGRIGKFYLLPNHTWEIAEKSIYSYPFTFNPITNPVFMNWAPVPASILHYMDNEGIASITGHFNWLIPALTSPGTYDYYSHAFSFTIDSTGVQLQHIGSSTIESLLSTDKRRITIENTSGSIY